MTYIWHITVLRRCLGEQICFRCHLSRGLWSGHHRFSKMDLYFGFPLLYDQGRVGASRAALLLNFEPFSRQELYFSLARNSHFALQIIGATVIILRVAVSLRSDASLWKVISTSSDQNDMVLDRLGPVLHYVEQPGQCPETGVKDQRVARPAFKNFIAS